MNTPGVPTSDILWESIYVRVPRKVGEIEAGDALMGLDDLVNKPLYKALEFPGKMLFWLFEGWATSGMTCGEEGCCRAWQQPTATCCDC